MSGAGSATRHNDVCAAFFHIASLDPIYERPALWTVGTMHDARRNLQCLSEDPSDQFQRRRPAMFGRAATGTAAPSDQRGVSTQHPYAASAPVRRPAWPWALAMIACSALALVAGVGTREATQHLKADLAGVVQAWDGTDGAAHSYAGLPRVTRAPVVGDEGFWLSRNDLAGSTAGPVALGDRITLSSKAAVADGTTAAVTHVFEVIELKSMAELGGGVATARHGGQDVGAPRTSFTMVVCREVMGSTAAAPRTIRFLIDSSGSAAAASVLPPRTL